MLAEGEPPLPPQEPSRGETDWFPYDGRQTFEMAEFLFKKNQMPGSQIDELFQIWASGGQAPPFVSKEDLYATIDDTVVGNVEWESFSVVYDGDDARVDGAAPWKTTEFDVWYRDPREILKSQLGNPDFAQEMDYAAKQLRDANGKRYYNDFMSGNWGWRQSVSFTTLLFSFLESL
jgi:hypothetical protein